MIDLGLKKNKTLRLVKKLVSCHYKNIILAQALLVLQLCITL